MNKQLILAVLLILIWGWGAISGNTTRLEDQAIIHLFMAVTGIMFCVIQVFEKEKQFSWIELVLFIPVSLYFVVRALDSEVGLFAYSDFVLIAVATITFFVSRTVYPQLFLSFIVAILCLFGLAAVDQKWSLDLPLLLDRRIDKKGVSGFYGHRIFYGDFVAGLGLFLAGAGLFSNLKKWMKVLLGIGAALAGFQVILSNSRGPMMVLALGGLTLVVLCVIYAWRSSDNKRVRLSSLFGLILALIGGVTVFTFWAEQISESRFGSSSILFGNSRMGYLKAALSLSPESPLIGGGANYFSYAAAAYGEGASLYQTNNMSGLLVHNEYLQALTDYGYIGLFLVIVCVCVLVFRVTYKLFLSDTFPSDWRFFAGAAVCAGQLGHAFVNAIFHTVPNLMMFAMAVSFCFIGEKKTVSNDRAYLKKSILALYLLGLSGGLFYIGLKYIPVKIAQSRAYAVKGDERVGMLSKLATNRPDYKGYELLARELHQLSYETKGDRDVSVDYAIRAARAYEKSFEYHPLQFLNYPKVIKMYRVALRYDDLERCAKLALEKFPNKEPYYQFRASIAEAHYLRGLGYWERGNYQKAREEFLEVSKIKREAENRKEFNGRKWPFLKYNDAMLALDGFRKSGELAEQFYFARKPEEALGAYEFALSQYRKTKGLKLTKEEREKWAKLAQGVKSRILFLKGAKIQAIPFSLPEQD